MFFASVWLSKPVGISTEFVVLAGMLWDAVDPGLVTGATSTNDYLASSKGSMAKDISNPLASYGLWFFAATVVGGALSHWLRRRAAGASGTERDPYTGQARPAAELLGTEVPTIWASRFGTNPWVRALGAFLRGILVLYGARLAGGCTSGHMMSGMMQTSISGYIFALGAFGAAVPSP